MKTAFFYLVSAIVIAPLAFGVERPPQAPPVNPSLTKSEPLANVNESTLTFSGVLAGGPGVPVLSGSECLNGQCNRPQATTTTRTITTQESCSTGSCGSYGSYTETVYTESYESQPKRGGGPLRALGRAIFGPKKSKGSSGFKSSRCASCY